MAPFGKRGVKKPGSEKAKPKSLLRKWHSRVMGAIKPAKREDTGNGTTQAQSKTKSKTNPKSGKARKQ